MQKLNAVATIWINNFAKLGFENFRRPTVSEINKKSKKYTGYRFVQTKQNVIMSSADWYKMTAQYEMPITNFVRKPSELDYCDEPDSFHEIMGHVVLLMDKEYSDMYQLLSKTYVEASKKKNFEVLRELDFIGGYIIELGLIKEKTGLKALGATLYSSGEIREAFKAKNQKKLGNKIPLSEKSYDRGSYQRKYYIVESLGQIVKLIKKAEKKL